jgi:hypothetical protein
LNLRTESLKLSLIVLFVFFPGSKIGAKHLARVRLLSALNLCING